MQRYDPFRAPEPPEWLDADEGERIAAVEEYHRGAKVKLPNAMAHAVAHVIVENQVAMGDALPVGRTVARLVSEGLDRHDAIHAVGSVLTAHLHALMTNEKGTLDPNGAYFAALERLTARTWRANG